MNYWLKQGKSSLNIYTDKIRHFLVIEIKVLQWFICTLKYTGIMVIQLPTHLLSHWHIFCSKYWIKLSQLTGHQQVAKSTTSIWLVPSGVTGGLSPVHRFTYNWTLDTFNFLRNNTDCCLCREVIHVPTHVGFSVLLCFFFHSVCFKTIW